MTTTIDRIETHVAKLKAGDLPVRPGEPAAFTEASAVGDRITQGDLVLTILPRVPEGYVRIERPTDADRQLVPGNTVGSRHCLVSLDGVALYRRNDWGKSADDLRGPVLVTEAAPAVIDHPTHGPVTTPVGFVVGCNYPRVWDAMQAQARRNAD